MQPCNAEKPSACVMTRINQTCMDHGYVCGEYAPGHAKGLFEMWLQTGLQRLYDRTLDEPVPDELLSLVETAYRPASVRS